MNFVGTALGSYLGIKLINGRLKPKFGKVRYFGLAFFLILDFIGLFLLGVGLYEFNSLENIIMPIVLISGCTYLCLISPLLVKDVVVIIEEGGVVNVRHKNKEVIVDLVKDDTGKFNFANPNKKHECIRYADGSKISSFHQYRIVNYLADDLHTNGLLSDDVRATLE